MNIKVKLLSIFLLNILAYGAFAEQVIVELKIGTTESNRLVLIEGESASLIACSA